MKAHTLSTSFISGALDDIALGRTETNVYRNGAKEIVNGMPLATGGMLSRWGTKHCVALPQAPIMEEFAFSDTQAYVAVFTDQRVDFFYAEDGVPAGFIYPCPWRTAQLTGLRFAQGGDVMWVTHPSFRTRVIRRVGTASWTIDVFSFENYRGMAYFRYESSEVVATWTAGTSTLSFSAGFLASGHNSQGIRVFDTASSSYCYGALSVLDSTSATVGWHDGIAPADGNNTTLWEEAAFSQVRGWPRSVALYQQRLVFGGGRDVGDAIWASQTGRFENFDVGTAQDGDALAFALGTTRVRTIKHVVAGQQLVFLTDKSAFWLPEADDRPLTPAGLLRVRNIADYGSGDARPGAFDGGILMVQKTGRAVRDIVYSNERENLIADPVSLAATDILGDVTDSAFLAGAQDRPEQFAFFVNAAGKMAVFHSVREQRIGAWVEWTTAGLFKAVAVAGGSVFVAVEREGTVRLERFDASRAFDAGVTSNQPFVGLAHLDGLTVHGRVDDDYLGDGVVASGGVTLRRETLQGAPPIVGAAEVGLAFDFWIDPLPPSIDLPDGSLIGRVQRVVRTGVRLYRARSCSIDGTELVLQNDGFALGSAPEPRDGWWHATHLGWARRGDDSRIIRRISRQVPMPVGVLALRREVVA